MEAVFSNIDLLTLILLRVPPKPLIRLKSVSKSWFSLISDPKFGTTHTCRNFINSHVSDFYYNKYAEDLFISLHGRSSLPTMTCLDLFTEYGVAKPEIVHSCKGLLLFRQRHCLRPIVFNPTTQKYRLLPLPPNHPYSYIDSHSSDFLLAFEPLKSHHYKVVIMSKTIYHYQNFQKKTYRYCFHVDIFASQTEYWERKLVTATPGKCCTRRIYWNGAIHWLTENNFHMQFDITSEKIIKNPLPSETIIDCSEKNRYFGENNGRLFLIQCTELGAPKFRMLEMDTNTLCWTIEHQIDLRPLVLQFPEMHRNRILETLNYSVLYVKCGADMKSFSLVLAIPEKLVVYEVENDKDYTNTDVLCDFLWHGDSRFVYPIIQCLAPV